MLKEIVTNNEHYFLPSNGTRRLAAGGTLLTFKLRGVNVRFCLNSSTRICIDRHHGEYIYPSAPRYQCIHTARGAAPAAKAKPRWRPSWSENRCRSYSVRFRPGVNSDTLASAYLFTFNQPSHSVQFAIMRSPTKVTLNTDARNFDDTWIKFRDRAEKNAM